MNIQLDLVLPPIIVGVLLMLILSMNRMMMESQTSNRLSYHMQTMANTTVQVLNEELRDLWTTDETALPDSALTYISIDRDTVSIYKLDTDMIIRRVSFETGLADSVIYGLFLSDLRFSWANQALGILRIRVEMESDEDMELSGTPVRFRAFAEKDYYLRNL